MTEGQQNHRIGDIECLRGAAVGMVILYHIHGALPLLLTALPLLALAAEMNYRMLEVPLRRRGAAIAARLAGQ